jgi:predicted small lipoprotein YifL
MFTEATNCKDTRSPSRAGGRGFPLTALGASTLQWIMIVAVALSLSACGKSGPPEPPNPQTDKFPRQYPDPSSL